MIRSSQPYLNRPDLSPYVFHLCGNHDVPGPFRKLDAQERLVGIIEDATIRAIRPFGAAVSELEKLIGQHRAKRARLSEILKKQRACCFTESPLETLSSHLEALPRNQQFAPFGICIGRGRAWKSMIYPVWYCSDFSQAPLMSLLSSDIARLARKGPSEISLALQMAPRFELVKRDQHLTKVFWWEREWRCVGDFNLPRRGALICPESERKRFQVLLDQDSHYRDWIIIHLTDPSAQNLEKLKEAIPDEDVEITT